MAKELITFETAKLASDKGFPQDRYAYPSFGDDASVHSVAYFCTTKPKSAFYNKVPQYVIQQWLRDECNIFLTIYCDGRGHFDYHGFNLDCNKVNERINPNNTIDDTHLFEIGSTPYRYNSYEKALECGLRESLMLLV